MKKKLVLITLTTALFLSCGSTVFADAKDDRIAELEAQVVYLQSQIKELKAQLSKYESNDDSEIEAYLLDKGVLIEDRMEMAGEMVSAISGFKYGKAEIYEYEENSEAYKILSSGGEIPLQGFDGITLSALEVNGKYVLMGEASEELRSAFKEFKQ